MSVFETIVAVIAIFLAVVAIFVIFGVIKARRDPDGIIAISETDGQIKANFILCIPTDEFLNRTRVTFEIQHISDDSQEIQEP